MTKMADTATAIGSSIARLSARDGKNPASIGVGEVAADISASVHATAATQGRQAPGAPQSGGRSTLGQAAAKIAQEAGVFIQQLKALPTADQVGVEAAHKQIQQGFLALLQAASGKAGGGAPPMPGGMG